MDANKRYNLEEVLESPPFDLDNHFTFQIGDEVILLPEKIGYGLENIYNEDMKTLFVGKRFEVQALTYGSPTRCLIRCLDNSVGILRSIRKEFVVNLWNMVPIENVRNFVPFEPFRALVYD